MKMYESVNANNVGKKNKIYMLSITAVMTAVICVLAPLSIPIGPVPISFTNLAIFITLYLLGWKMGTVSLALYILIGTVGIPVFSGFSGGLGKLMGPTGGYIIGFVPMAVIIGLIIEKFSSSRVIQFAAMIVGTAVCYAFGTVWFCVVMDSGVASALGLCVFPFIPGDIAKIIIALIVGPMLRSRLHDAGLIG